MTDLVRELELLAADVGWPPTPVLAPRQAARRVAGRGRRRRRVAVAVALAVLLLAAAALAATGVIRLSGGVTIRRVERLPPVDPAPRLALGTVVTMAQARAILPVRLPARLAHPDAAYQDPSGVSFLYLDARSGSRPRAILTVLRDGPALIDKLVAIGTPVRRVRVGGAPGVFVAGPHVSDFLYGRGRRRSGPTLLWARDGLVYRLESRDALALASAP